MGRFILWLGNYGTHVFYSSHEHYFLVCSWKIFSFFNPILYHILDSRDHTRLALAFDLFVIHLDSCIYQDRLWNRYIALDINSTYLP